MRNVRESGLVPTPYYHPQYGYLHVKGCIIIPTEIKRGKEVAGKPKYWMDTLYHTWQGVPIPHHPGFLEKESEII